jgi:hypothetical protein
MASPLGVESLHAADWHATVRLLDSHGWEPLDGNGTPMLDGYTLDGREVIALYGRDPITSEPDFDAIRESIAALHELAGIEVFAR